MPTHRHEVGSIDRNVLPAFDATRKIEAANENADAAAKVIKQIFKRKQGDFVVSTCRAQAVERR